MYPAKYRQALAHLRTNAHNLDPEKGRWEHKGRYNRCGLISFQKEYLIHGRWILVCVRLFFHKPLKIYYVFLPVVLAFFPSLSFPVVRPNYAVIVGEKKTSAACSLLLPVNDKKGLDMFHTTSLVSSSVVCTFEVTFSPTNQGAYIMGNIVFCLSPHLNFCLQ